MKYPVIKSTRKEFDFSEFYTNSDRDYPGALLEMRRGSKTGHWIWYILPQLSTLGTSRMAIHFGLKSLHEAVSYYKDSVLGPRLIEICTAINGHLDSGANIQHLMGSPTDAVKLLMCATLFSFVARCSQTKNDLTLFLKLRRNCEKLVRAENEHTITFCEVSLLCLSPTTWPEHIDMHFVESHLSRQERVSLMTFSLGGGQYTAEFPDEEYRGAMRQSVHEHVLMLLPSSASLHLDMNDRHL